VGWGRRWRRGCWPRVGGGGRAGEAGGAGADAVERAWPQTDEADALSVAVAAWTAPALVSVRFDELAMALRALTEHRDDLVKARTQTVNRLHVLLAQLIPGGAPGS
jgi:Transposase